MKMNPKYKPNVVLVGSDPAYLLNFRGELILELIEQGFDVTTISWDGPPDVIDSIKGIGVRDHIIAPIRQGSINPIDELLLVISLFNSFKKLMPYSVVAYTAKPVVSGMIAAWLAGVRSRVALVEGMGFSFTRGSGIFRKLAKALLTIGYALSLRLASSVIVLNETDRDQVARLSGRKYSAIHVVAGIGVPGKYYVRSAPTKGLVRFIYVGRILLDKGIGELIEACKILRDENLPFEMVFVGAHDRNPTAYPKDEFERELKNINATWLGHSSDVAAEIRTAHVLVLPSYREGFPRVVMEAMAGARAAIVSDVPGCRDSVVHGKTGLIVAPYSGKSLADGMRMLLQDSELRVAMSEAAFVYAAQHFKARDRARELIQKAGIEV